VRAEVIVTLLLVVLIAVVIIATQWWRRYKTPASYEDIAKIYGLTRERREALSAWERRIFLANKEACDSGKALTNEARRLGLFRTFPPRMRPRMPEDVTWTTGILFYPTYIEPYIAWLPNTHPLSVRYRLAKGPDYEGVLGSN
jgi:hypothetical protein